MSGLEQYFTVAQVAERLSLSQDTVRRIFSKIPGTLLIREANGFARKYVTVRIPESILQSFVVQNTVKPVNVRRRAA